MAPQRLCPRCNSEGRFVAPALEGSSVEYYRCNRCRCVWCQDSKDPGAAPKEILRPVPDRRRRARTDKCVALGGSQVPVSREFTMAARICPKCQMPGRHLAATSENAVVDYYRCDGCGHVWAIDKQGARRDVTIPITIADADRAC
jgi:Zn-finger nucleic acid-binding protein